MTPWGSVSDEDRSITQNLQGSYKETKNCLTKPNESTKYAVETK